MKTMIKRNLLFIIIILDAIVLLTQTSNISISYAEASLLYGESSFLQSILKVSISVFSQNDFALRFPMITMHLLSLILLYENSKKYLLHDRDRIWLVAFFILLPGVLTSALLVNSAGLIIFGLLLFAYTYDNFSIKYSNFLSLVYVLLDPGFIYLFLGMGIYFIYKKQVKQGLFNLFLFVLSIYIYGFEMHGIPTGHFVDVIGIYATVFTPIVFLYIFYALYREYLNDKMDYIWYLATVALIFSLIASFRQRVDIEHFAPYLLISLPLVARTFIDSYKVRLKIFRGKYRLMFLLSFIFLVFNYFVVIFNKELYLILDNPKKHFAYNTQIASELAEKLKSIDIVCVETNEKMQLRLRFYGITNCSDNLLKDNTLHPTERDNVTISYIEKKVYSANVTKINKIDGKYKD